MKYCTRLFTAGLILIGSVGSFSFAESPSEIRDEAEKAFRAMANNSVQAVEEIQNSRENGEKSVAVKFRISEVQAPTSSMLGKAEKTQTPEKLAFEPSRLCIKVWFELADGTLINPTMKQWKPGERFFVHIQAAAPIYVGVFQNFPDEDPLSLLVYPNRRYRESFHAIQASQSLRLPVVFETEQDLQDEIMSMVVVRSDWQGIQAGLTDRATDSIKRVNGKVQVSAQVTETGAGTMKSINDSVVSEKNATAESVKKNIQGIGDKEAGAISEAINDAVGQVKFRINGSSVESSKCPEDVCFYMFGPGEIGRWQLTIRK